MAASPNVRRPHRQCATALLAAACFAQCAEAKQEPLYEFGLGVGALAFYDYRGSDTAHGYPLPLPYLLYNGKFLKANRDGIRGTLFNQDRFELNLSFDATTPVRSDRERSGMPDLKSTVELGPAVDLHLMRSDDARVKLDLRMPLRAGIGYDIHARAKGRPLVLGGVRFESAWGLVGHSDADVVSHAIGDALLGAVALGDLGAHFPPGDPKWRDASSLDLLARIAALLRGRGARIVNVDAMVLAEAPKLAPAREAMIANLARALGIERSQVSVKATTNEGLGAIGRGEGIAAWAAAMVEMP